MSAFTRQLDEAVAPMRDDVIGVVMGGKADVGVDRAR